MFKTYTHSSRLSSTFRKIVGFFFYISVERTFLSDAVCTASIHDLGVVLTIESAQPKLCEIHNVLYSNTDSFTISERKVTISYICNEKRRPYNRIVEFYILQNDIEFWNELSNAFGK